MLLPHGMAFIVLLMVNTQISAQIGCEKYNQVYREACHNCYEKNKPSAWGNISLQNKLDHISNIEIDFYDSQAIFTGTGGMFLDWYVRHDPTGTNDNCCGSGDGKLSTCLTDILIWSNNHPNHDVITVFLDKKQGWSGPVDGRNPEHLDFLIENTFPAEKLFRPIDLKGSYNSLREAAQNDNWPTMGDLRGKIIFVLTGGQLANHNKTQKQYVEARENLAVAFVAPDTDENGDITGTPNQFDSSTDDFVVFYNIEIGNEAQVSATVHDFNYVSRNWDANSSNEDCNKFNYYAQNLTTNFVAFYNVNLIEGKTGTWNTGGTDLNLSNTYLTTKVSRVATRITAGNNYTVSPSSDLALAGGSWVRLISGFTFNQVNVIKSNKIGCKILGIVIKFIAIFI